MQSLVSAVKECLLEFRTCNILDIENKQQNNIITNEQIVNNTIQCQ